jgi:hypothetical protein
MPKIGDRVKYRHQTEFNTRECTGTVVRLWHSYAYNYFDEELGERVHGKSRNSASVQVDKPLPKWWPYPGTDRFAPDIEYLELVPRGRT